MVSGGDRPGGTGGGTRDVGFEVGAQGEAEEVRLLRRKPVGDVGELAGKERIGGCGTLFRRDGTRGGKSRDGGGKAPGGGAWEGAWKRAEEIHGGVWAGCGGDAADVTRRWARIKVS